MARGFAVDDFIRYMFSQSTREAILARFDDVANPLLARGASLHVIAPPFEITQEYLGKRPEGCATVPGRPDTALNFVCAHRSYFQPSNDAVQRDILARAIHAAGA